MTGASRRFDNATISSLASDHRTPPAGQQHRAARLLQETHGRGHGLRLGGGRGHFAVNQPAHVRQLDGLVQHVPGEVQMHGSGDPRHGALVGFPGQGRCQLGLAHLHRPLDDGPEHGLLVDLLGRIPEHVLHHRRAGNDQHRALGVVSVGYAGQQVGGAGTVGGDAHAGPARDPCRSRRP